VAEASRKGLKSADAAERRAAATRLRELGAEATPAVPDLTGALRDVDAGVRAAAIDALAAAGPQGGSAYAEVLRSCGATEPQVQQAAEQYLKAFDSPPAAAKPGLMNLASDTKQPPVVQVRVLTALVRVAGDSPDVLPLFVRALASPSEPVREQAVRCLGHKGLVHDREVLRGLLAALDDPSASVRNAAGKAIGVAGPIDARDVPALVEGFDRTSDRLCLFILGELSRLGKDARDAVSDVSRALRNRDSSVRLAAMDCLLTIAPDHHSDVAVLLVDRDKDIRKAAVTALRRTIAPAAYFEMLADVLAATDEGVRKEMAVALDLAQLPAASDVPARTKVRLSTAMTDINPLVRLKAVKSLQRLGWASAPEVRVLAGLLREDADGVSREAAQTLRQIGDSATRQVTPDLLRALGSRDAATRKEAAKALRSVGRLKPDTVSDLVAALSDGALRDDVSALVAEVGEDAVPELMRALKDPEAAKRRGAAKTLGMIGKKASEAYKPLAELYRHDPDPAVRQEASEALDVLHRAR
jgi:HEAT repeat protein